MWSRNGSPVATFTRPPPSSETRALSCVSLLLRLTSPTRALLKSHLHRMRVTAQAFHPREPDRGLAKHLQVAAVQAQQAGPLHERVHAERRGEASRAGRRQRVVGTRGVIAERDRRVGAHENRARVLDLRGEPRAILGNDEQVLWSEV